MPSVQERIISNIQTNVAEAELLPFVNKAYKNMKNLRICICEKFKIRRKDKDKQPININKLEFKAPSNGEGQNNQSERF